jgi:hypothetical protein
MVLLVVLVGGPAKDVYAGEQGAVPVDHWLGNGLHVRLFTPDDLLAHTEVLGTRGTIRLAGGGTLTVITDTQDPLITNKGDGHFHPIDERLLIDVLGEIDYPGLRLGIEVYLLPFPRADQLASSAVGDRIYLSPQVGEISRADAAYIVAHEVGHTFQHRYLSDRASRHWTVYRSMRGIDDPGRFGAEKGHAYRPKEIFAEDFRILFGGAAARFEGRVENPEIIPPLLVSGLRDFFVELPHYDPEQPDILAINSVPNPFNPQTDIRLKLTDEFLATGERISVRIYDVRGAMVRKLYDGAPGSTATTVRWDGRNANGVEVASGTYYGVILAGRSKRTVKLLMIK